MLEIKMPIGMNLCTDIWIFNAGMGSLQQLATIKSP